MPQYEYRCAECGRRSRLFFSYAEYGKKTAVCAHCQSTHMQRLIGRVAVGRSEGDRLEGMMDEQMLANVDENDPQAIGQMMRQMSQEMGEELGDDFNEVVDRLSSGESPESIEKSMPNLGEGVAGSDTAV